MVFEIIQHSTLPILKMRLKTNSYRNINDFFKRMESAEVIFSMYDEENNKFILLNKKGDIQVKERVVPSGYDYDLFIFYKFTSNDTKKIGYYKGEFLIKFLDNDCFDDLRVPILEPLYINIKPSLTKTTVNTNNC